MSLQNQQTSRLCSLPEEILIHTLSLTPPASLVVCRAVCRMLRDLIKDAIVLMYHVELYADGMVDGEDCQLPVAERLSQLRIRRQAWREIKWEHRLFPLIPGSWNAYELVDGVFSKTLNSIGQNTARGILFASLPSRGNATGSLILFEDLGITFRDFAMDPTQDLIVYMQCSRLSDPTGFPLTHVTLHFRTMSENKTHPQACRPTVSVAFRSEVFGAVIQTVNEIVGFMSWDNSHSQLFIWDWKRCMQVVSETDLAVLDDFAFISDRAYVLTSPVPVTSFQVYTFDTSPRAYGSPPPPSLRARLHLPAMHEGATASLLRIHTGPFTSTSSQLLRPAKPFMTAPHSRIHVINIDLASGPNPHAPAISCLIVIRNQTFLSYVNAEPSDVPWEDWGPSQTRWIPGGTGSLWLRYVHGERLVRLHAAADDGSRYLEMFDFGVPRGPPSWVTPQEEILMHQSHVLYLDTVFKSPVIFQLPCRVMTKRESFPYSGFMVDEDRLIGLKRHWDDDATSVDVFTF